MTIHDLLSLEPVVYFVLSVTSFVLLLRALPGKVARQFLLAIGVYVLHGAFGIAVLIYLRPVLSNTSAAGFGVLAALFAWFGLGLHVLFRLTPSEKAKPRWLLRFGLFDVACLPVLAGGSAVAAGFI
jgi:hypothetical protein